MLENFTGEFTFATVFASAGFTVCVFDGGEGIGVMFDTGDGSAGRSTGVCRSSIGCGSGSGGGSGGTSSCSSGGGGSSSCS